MKEFFYSITIATLAALNTSTVSASEHLSPAALYGDVYAGKYLFNRSATPSQCDVVLETVLADSYNYLDPSLLAEMGENRREDDVDKGDLFVDGTLCADWFGYAPTG